MSRRDRAPAGPTRDRRRAGRRRASPRVRTGPPASPARAARPAADRWMGSPDRFRWLLSLARPSMTVARNVLLRDALILDRGLEHHAVGELVDHGALDLLP